METAALIGLINQLDGNLDQLEEALGPLLEDSLNATSKKLPLLDRAKLNVTVVYAIESLIFSYLKVNGIDPRGHTIFKEIERVKQYFNKIKEVEEQSTVKPSITLNKQAAARIIHHSLAGNGSPDLAQREREARERFLLKRKLKTEGANTSPGTKSAPISPPSTPPIEVPIPPPSVPTDQDADMQQDSSAEEGEIDQDESSIHITELPRESTTATGNQRKKRKQKHGAEPSSKLSADRKAEKKARKKAKKEAKDAANTGGNAS